MFTEFLSKAGAKDTSVCNSLNKKGMNDCWQIGQVRVCLRFETLAGIGVSL